MGRKYRDIIRERSNVKGGMRFTLYMLADYATDDGLAWPGLKTLARDCGTSKQTIINHLNKLQEIGAIALVEAGTGRGNQNKWRIMYDENGIIKGSKQDGKVSNRLTLSPDDKGSNLSDKGSNLHSERVKSGEGVTLYREPQEPEGTEESARDWQPTLDATPAPAPTPSEKTKNRGRVTSKNIDPRKIGPDGLIPEGEGETPLEAWREYSSYTPTAAQIREMMKIENLGEWRAHVQECVVRRGFKGCGNVLDTWANGFRQPANGYNGYNGNGKQSGRIFDAAPTASVSGIVRPPECPERIWTQLRDSQQRAMAEAEPAQRRIFVERTEQRIRERNGSGV